MLLVALSRRTGGFVAADVLLPGLQSQAQRRASFRIHRLTDDPAGHLTLVALTGGKKGGMGTAAGHGHTETLSAAHGDVSPERPDGSEQHLGQGINRHGGQSTVRMGRSDQRRWIPEMAVATGQLQQHPKDVLVPAEGIRLAHLQADPQRRGPGLKNRQGLWQGGRIHQKTTRLRALAHSQAEAHRFSAGRALIEQ